MAQDGVLLVWIEPAEPGPYFDAWRHAGGFLSDIPGATAYSVLAAMDDTEQEKPHRFQISYVITDFKAITQEVYDKATASKPDCLRSSEWHLYKQILYSTTSEITAMPVGSVCVQVGITPRNEPEIVEDLTAWFNDEHLPMLKEVPGYRICRRGEFVRVLGSADRISEYPAPFVGWHRYEEKNGLNGPKWQESVRTEWTMKVKQNLARPHHRRVWRIEKDIEL